MRWLRWAAVALKGAAGCERLGGKGETAQSKGDRKSNHGPTQHELPLHRELPFRWRPCAAPWRAYKQGERSQRGAG
jgi:hypothetical protein